MSEYLMKKGMTFHNLFLLGGQLHGQTYFISYYGFDVYRFCRQCPAGKTVW